MLSTLNAEFKFPQQPGRESCTQKLVRRRRCVRIPRSASVISWRFFRRGAAFFLCDLRRAGERRFFALRRFFFPDLRLRAFFA